MNTLIPKHIELKMMVRGCALCVALGVIMLTTTGCGTVKSAAIAQVVDAFAGENAMLVYTSDDDPQLVWDALPFGLKTTEMLLANDPDNPQLLLSAAKGYVIYGQGHLGLTSRNLEFVDFKQAKQLRKRAHKLSLRGRDFALTALDSRYPGFKKAILKGDTSVLKEVDEDDVPFLYWAAAGWAGATASFKSDMNGIAELPIAEAVMRKVLELNDGYQNGAVHEFFVAFEAAHAPAAGGSLKRAEEHFSKAVKYSHGDKASPYVTFAESVLVKRQDLKRFRKVLKTALAIDPDKVKPWRLENTIAQDKAKWLLEKAPELFFEYEEEKDL